MFENFKDEKSAERQDRPGGYFLDDAGNAAAGLRDGGNVLLRRQIILIHGIQGRSQPQPEPPPARPGRSN